MTWKLRPCRTTSCDLVSSDQTLPVKKRSPCRPCIATTVPANRALCTYQNIALSIYICLHLSKHVKILSINSARASTHPYSDLYQNIPPEPHEWPKTLTSLSLCLSFPRSLALSLSLTVRLARSDARNLEGRAREDRHARLNRHLHGRRWVRQRCF